MTRQKPYPNGTKIYVVFLDEEDFSIEEATIEKYAKMPFGGHYEARICSLNTINILAPNEVHPTIEGAIKEAEMVVGEKVRKLNRSLKELKKKWRKKE